MDFDFVLSKIDILGDALFELKKYIQEKKEENDSNKLIICFYPLFSDDTIKENSNIDYVFNGFDEEKIKETFNVKLILGCKELKENRILHAKRINLSLIIAETFEILTYV